MTSIHSTYISEDLNSITPLSTSSSLSSLEKKVQETVTPVMTQPPEISRKRLKKMRLAAQRLATQQTQNKPSITDENILNVLSKPLFKFKDFIQLVNFYKDNSRKIDCQTIIDKCREQIIQKQTSHEMRRAAKLCESLNIPGHVIIEHNGQSRHYPFYYEQLLQLEFVFFKGLFINHPSLERSIKRENDNIHIGLQPPFFEPEDFLDLLERYLKWLYENSEEFDLKFIFLQEYLSPISVTKDATRYLFSLIDEEKINEEDLIELAKSVSENPLISLDFKTKLTPYLLAIAVKNQKANKKGTYSFIKDFFDKLDGLITLSVSTYPDINLELVAPFLSKVGKLQLDGQTSPNILIDLLKKCVKLKELDLTRVYFNRYNPPKKLSFQQITGTCSQLKSISIDGALIDIDDSKTLAEDYEKLTQLNLSYCKVQENTLRFIQNCSNLQSINLTYCEITDEALISLAIAHKNLAQMKLVECKGITDQSIIAIAENCPNLTVINLASYLNISTNAIQTLMKNCLGITHMSLNQMRIQGETLVDSIIQFTRLNTIDLSLSKFTPQFIENIARQCPNLEHLNLSNSNVTNEMIGTLIIHCPKLTHIDLSYSSNSSDISNETIVAIAKKCSHLKSLTLTGCHNVTDQALQFVVDNCSNLQYINLKSCILITDKMIKSLEIKYPKINFES